MEVAGGGGGGRREEEFQSWEALGWYLGTCFRASRLTSFHFNPTRMGPSGWRVDWFYGITDQSLSTC